MSWSDRRHALLALAAATLAGCGFELRRPPALSFHSIALTGFAPRSALADELRRNLALSVRVLDVPAQAEVVLQALSDVREKGVVATTSATAYVRFHGRNLGTWNKRGGSAAERFDYLYSDAELDEWTPVLKELAGRAERAFAFFNNNATAEDPQNPLGRVSQAATNAQQLRRLLDVNRISATA